MYLEGTLVAGTHSSQFSAEDTTRRTLATAPLYVRASSGQIVSFDVRAEVIGWPIVTVSGTAYGPVGAAFRPIPREIHLPVVLKQ